MKIENFEARIIEIQHILSISLANSDDLLHGLKLCLESCLQVSGMDCGGIYLFDDTTGNLSLRVHKGLKKEFIKSALVHDKDSPNVSLVNKGKPIYTLADQLKLILNEDQQNEGLKTLATIPLFDKIKVIGCINIGSHRFDDFNITSRMALEAIAAQAGNVIARLKATQALRESEEHLTSLMLNAENYAIYRLAASDTNPHKLTVVFVSPSIVDIMGIKSPHVFETWFENIHDDDKERIIEASLQAFQTHKFNEVFRIYHPQRKGYRWIHSISNGIGNIKGETKFVNGIMIDITKSKILENSLIQKEMELKEKTNKLEEINLALKVMLDKREKDKIDLQKNVFHNVKELIIPYIQKLREMRNNENRTLFIDIIESNINRIISPFSHKLTSKDLGLTPTELKIADLIRQGKNTKEISKIRNISHRTVEVHRANIRKKIGIKNKKGNLQTHLKILMGSNKAQLRIDNKYEL
jgi:DNA-binding CsgD family transcriptional regulator/PAS domain-containing protein